MKPEWLNKYGNNQIQPAVRVAVNIPFISPGFTRRYSN
jgi:hypothetical protein